MANNFRILTHAPQWVKEFYNWCNSKFIKTVNGVHPDENGNVTVEVSSESGTTDYAKLVNKPSINGIELSGNKTTANLKLASASHTHTGYASSSHTHSNYASSTHTHSYAPVSHTHSEYAASSHGTHVTSSTCVTSFNGKKGDVSGVSSLTVINTKDGVETNRTGKMTGDVDLTIDSTGDTIITNTYPTAGVTSVSLGTGSSKTGVVNFTSDEIRDAHHHDNTYATVDHRHDNTYAAADHLHTNTYAAAEHYHTVRRATALIGLHFDGDSDDDEFQYDIVGFPAYANAVKIDMKTELTTSKNYIVPYNGWLSLYLVSDMSNSGGFIKVDDIAVGYCAGSDTAWSNHSVSLVPVTAGSTVTRTAHISNDSKCYFIPFAVSMNETWPDTFPPNPKSTTL